MTKLDLNGMQAALDRAAHKAVHGTREERSGRFDMTTMKCRAVVVSADGKSYPTRWRKDKPVADLGPDEFAPINLAIKDAERLAKRKKISVKRIDGQFTK